MFEGMELGSIGLWTVRGVPLYGNGVQMRESRWRIKGDLGQSNEMGLDNLESARRSACRVEHGSTFSCSIISSRCF